MGRYPALPHHVYTPERRERIRARINWFAWLDEFYGTPIGESVSHPCRNCGKPTYHIGFIGYGGGAGMVHIVQIYHCPDCDEILHGEHSK